VTKIKKKKKENKEILIVEVQIQNTKKAHETEEVLAKHLQEAKFNLPRIFTTSLKTAQENLIPPKKKKL
jgi:hypothetical protein